MDAVFQVIGQVVVGAVVVLGILFGTGIVSVTVVDEQDDKYL